MTHAINTDYDVIVIGGGPAGENAAARAAVGGLKVGLVERQLLGGECSYWACMPSKALLRPAEALAVAQRAPGAAQAVTGEIDVAAVLERRNRLSSNWDDAGQAEWAAEADLDVIRGRGRLSGERQVTVEDSDGILTTYEVSKAVVVATGSGAAWPPIPGLAEAGVWDNREATTADNVPERLLVIGGGVVGCELAQAWRSLGAREVTIVELQDQLLPREEEFAGQQLQKAFEHQGISVMVGASVTAARRTAPRGPVQVTLADGSTIETDEVLVAAGRRPNTKDVGLETVGLEPGRLIDVDDAMRVTDVAGDWLYAVGDVNGRALLTHTGKYQARIAGDNIAGRGNELTAFGDKVAIPRVVFTDPNVAAVGLTLAQALDSGINATAVDYELGRVAGSATLGRGIRGTCRIVVDDDRRVLVGATFVGPGTAELVHAATIAIVGEVTIDRLWHAIPSFPTQSEIWLRFLEEYGL